MRPIRYKAWDTKRKKMWSAEELGKDELTLNPDGRGFVNVNSVSTKLSVYMDHLIPLEFTGFLDRQDKEIYEEDIVEVASWKLVGKNPYARVYWDKKFKIEHDLDGHYSFCDTHIIKGDNVKVMLADALELLDIKVIGNIFENPELLEEKNEKN